MKELIKRLKAVYIILRYGVPKLPTIKVPIEGHITILRSTLQNVCIEI